MALRNVSLAFGDFAPWTLVLGGVTVGLAALVAREFRSWYRLRHVPGPLLHSISIYGMNKLAMSGRMAFALKEMGEKYGR